MLEGPGQPGLQERDPDGEPGVVGHRVQHGVDHPAIDGRRRRLQVFGRSGSAGIRAAAKGETTIGITFLHDSVAQAVQGYPIKTVAPCEGTGYEIISSAIIKGGPNPEGAKKWMDFVLSPAGQNVAITVNKFQIPSNRNAQVHPMAPKAADLKLIKLDLDKYGSKEGRERLLSRWENEVFKAPK